MIKFTGKLNRPQYWKAVVLILVCLVVTTGVFNFLLDIQNAEMDEASTLSINLAIAFFVMLLISVIYFTIALIGAVIRRTHDINNSMLWIFLGLFIPFGFVVIGFVPSKE